MGRATGRGPDRRHRAHQAARERGARRWALPCRSSCVLPSLRVPDGTDHWTDGGRGMSLARGRRFAERFPGHRLTVADDLVQHLDGSTSLRTARRAPVRTGRRLQRGRDRAHPRWLLGAVAAVEGGDRGADDDAEASRWRWQVAAGRLVRLDVRRTSRSAVQGCVRGPLGISLGFGVRHEDPVDACRGGPVAERVQDHLTGELLNGRTDDVIRRGERTVTRA